METNNYEKKYKTLVSALHKNAECPLCLETVKPSFKLCVQGHSVCLECIKKLEKCPLCQGTFVSENPVCVKNMLETLPHLCCYSDAGCEELVEPGNDHEMFCGYRPINCRFEGCSIKMPVVQVLDHYKSNHPNTLILDKHENNKYWLMYKTITVMYTPVTLFKNMFWIVYVNEDSKEYLKIFFEATPIGKLTRDYYVCIEFKKGKMIYAFTSKAKVLSSCETKLIGNEPEELDEVYCMKIPKKELHHFAKEEGKLQYTLKFFKM